MLHGEHVLMDESVSLVYYESIKRELKVRPIYECWCNERRLSAMSGLASNPANREIASSSGASEHRDIFFFGFFSIFFLEKTLNNMI